MYIHNNVAHWLSVDEFITKMWINCLSEEWYTQIHIHLPVSTSCPTSRDKWMISDLRIVIYKVINLFMPRSPHIVLSCRTSHNPNINVCQEPWNHDPAKKIPFLELVKQEEFIKTMLFCCRWTWFHPLALLSTNTATMATSSGSWRICSYFLARKLARRCTYCTAT